MLWLVAHMWILLTLSFAIGLSIGWWVWGLKPSHAIIDTDEEPMGTLDSDFTPSSEEAKMPTKIRKL